FRLKEVGASSRRLLRFRGFNARRFSVATLHRILSRMTWRNISLALSLVMASGVFSAESDGVTPWRQDQPPNPPYSPQEALSKISVPEGCNVELVASEPDIVNPIPLSFADRRRFWPPRHTRVAEFVDVGSGRMALRIERRVQSEPR